MRKRLVALVLGGLMTASILEILQPGHLKQQKQDLRKRQLRLLAAAMYPRMLKQEQMTRQLLSVCSLVWECRSSGKQWRRHMKNFIRM